MSNLIRRFTTVGAVLAISSIALVGCTSADAPAPKDSATKSSQPTEAPKTATADGAATFANDFLAAVISDKPSATNFNPPVKLTDEQSKELVLDGKVEGVSDEKLNELVDYLYANHPLGKYIYFDGKATVQERLRVISALVLVQSYADDAAATKAPEKIVADDVTLRGDSEATRATFQSGTTDLAPTAIFLPGSGMWKVDGKELLKSFGSGTTDTEATPAPTSTDDSPTPDK